jgi:hypothetical protein
MSPFKKEIIDEIRQKNFQEGEQKYIKLFYLRGGFNFNKFNFTNKIIMNLFKWGLRSKRKKTTEEIQILAAYEKPVDFTKKENIKELTDYVDSLR